MRSSAKFTHRVLLRRSYPFLKFAYFLKSTRYYSKRIWTNLSSDKALNIQGEYEHLFQYTARKYINGSLTQKEFERKFLYRQQNEKAKIDIRFSVVFCELLRNSCSLAYFCSSMPTSRSFAFERFRKRDTRSILDETQILYMTSRTSE